MEYTPEEEERIKAIQRHLEGEEPIEVYRSIGRSKRWFNKCRTYAISFNQPYPA